MKTFSAPPTNVSLTRLVLLLLIFGSVILSCRNDDSNALMPDEEDGQYTMYYRILNFIETKDGMPSTSPIISNRTTYSTADILDYIEGAMNLQYTDSRLSWASYDVRTDTFTIPLTAGYASQQDLEDLFIEIEDTASVHFYGISEPDKFPLLYDATNLSSNLSLMTLSVTARVGKVHRDPTPFGSTDYWNVYGGKCGPYSGGTSQASEVIADALNDYYAPYGCTFFTSVTTAYYQDLKNYGWDDTNTGDTNPGDFILDYRTYMFHCWDYQSWGDPEEWGCEAAIGFPDCSEFDGEDIQCLEPDEMNYYFESIREIYADFRSAQANPYLTHINSVIILDPILCLQTQEGWNPIVSFGQPNACNSSNYPTYLPPCCN